MNLLRRYTHWLHTRWPANGVETLPVVNSDGSTNVAGLWIVGDLAGVPLLKFSADSGAKTAARISREGHMLDVVIVGAGVAGVAAAIEAKKQGLTFKLLDASEKFSTIVNFPKAKPIYTYPPDMTPAGELQFRDEVHPKETLLQDLRKQSDGIEAEIVKVSHVERISGGLRVVINDKPVIEAKQVILAIGRSGNYRKLGVPGENADAVSNRLHDPHDLAGKNVVVVGGGDTAAETAIALAEAGANVTLSYRGDALSRPKPQNAEAIERLTRGDAATPLLPEKPADSMQSQVSEPRSLKVDPKRNGKGSLTTAFGTKVESISDGSVALRDSAGQTRTVAADNVFIMIGREPPLDFLRRSGVRIRNERTTRWWVTLLLFLAFCVWMYHWKKEGVHVTGIDSIDAWLSVGTWWKENGWFPFNVGAWLTSLGGAWNRKSNILGVLHTALAQPGFYYSLAYCACVVGFGIDRIRRRKTPYVKWQTITLAIIQVVPLFLLPYLILPWMGHNGWFTGGGWMTSVADSLFERYDEAGYDRAYWRAFGFILAWPLFFWNVFTAQPMWAWLTISVAQTFVLIPLMIYFWGKGSYCGWICSCGALAETLGDRHRDKMPHGPFWNRLNMLGQAFLAFALLLLGLRIIGWIWPGGRSAAAFEYLLNDLPIFNYVWFVDLLWAGIFGVGLYFWFSGRVWCRFGCPLAALMHIYTRFSKYAIVADKKKCISCSVCTTVCHQGIDVMSFANKGLPMQDPQCVRCSACVQMCPTNVLSFGMVDKQGKTIRTDKLRAVSLTVNGKAMTH